MKTLLLAALWVIISIGAGVAVGAHYKNYQTQKTHEARVAENETARRIAQIKTEAEVNAKAYQLQVDKLKAECEKGRVIYESLTTTQKAKTVAPVCTAE